MTAGVEKRIILHSPTPSSPCTYDLSRSPEDVRELIDAEQAVDRLAFVEVIMGSFLEGETRDDRDEMRTIRLFDQ